MYQIFFVELQSVRVATNWVVVPSYCDTHYYRCIINSRTSYLLLGTLICVPEIRNITISALSKSELRCVCLQWVVEEDRKRRK